MADVNAWSIIVPGVVTPVVVAGFAFSQQRAQRKQMAIDELRLTVDAAALVLTEASSAVLRLAIAWQLGHRVTLKLNQPAVDSLRDLRFATDRLMIRLGGASALARAHQEAADAVWDYYGLVLESTGRGLPYDPAAHRHVTARARESRRRFLETARTIVGHDLEHTPSPLHPTLPLPTDTA